MFAGFDTLTWIHTLLSIVALVAGAIGIKGLLESRVTPVWTEIYLATAVLTSATGFLFKASFQASHVTGIICLILLAAALVGLYVFKLHGPWRWVYAVGFVLSTYLDYFVLVVQLFRKIPSLHALAPNESEPPFTLAQLVLLAIFIWLTVKSVRKFHPTAP